MSAKRKAVIQLILLLFQLWDHKNPPSQACCLYDDPLISPFFVWAEHTFPGFSCKTGSSLLWEHWQPLFALALFKSMPEYRGQNHTQDFRSDSCSFCAKVLFLQKIHDSKCPFSSMAISSHRQFTQPCFCSCYSSPQGYPSHSAALCWQRVPE